MAILPVMEDSSIPKKVLWVGSARKDLKKFPKPVQNEIGQTLWEVQMGQMPPSVKLLKGFSDGPVMEIIEDHDGDTYRAVFTARFADAIYVLHCFQKKSKRGAKTPRPDKELIRNRLNEVSKSHRKEKL